MRKIVRKFRKLHKMRKVRNCAICVALYAFFSALAQFALRSMPFFQRLRNLRLRIGNICCALIVNFFQDAQSQNNF